MHAAYRKSILARVAAAIDAANAVANLGHHGLEGQLREILVRDLFRPLLPADVGVGCGQVISSEGQTSRQQDVLVYDRQILPPVLFEQSVGFFPVESVLFTIEVKSRLTAHELGTADDAAADLLNFVYSPGLRDTQGALIDHTVTKAISTVFALSSDLQPGGKTEIERYREIHDASQPAVQAVCVVGSGYWFWNEGQWHEWKRACEYDEVMGFIAGVMDNYRSVAHTRREPNLGRYIV